MTGFLLPTLAHAQEGKPIPRVLLALYNGEEESSPRATQVHRFLEMPANHLGFDVRYADVQNPLPVLGDEVRGIVVWFNSGSEVPDAKAYLEWLTSALAQGKKLVVVENPGIGASARKDAALVQKWNRALGYIGLMDGNGWNAVTYQARIARIDREMVGFERPLEGVLPPFGDTRIIPGKAKSHLQVTINKGQASDTVDLITTGKGGGYVAEGFAIFHVVEENKTRISQWFINPFEFLKQSLDAGFMPVPDVTTLNGRRIFYSHIDGDGWNNISEIKGYEQNHIISAEVLRREILKPYSDFAFNVGLITADVDPDCFGLKGSDKVARDIFALPNVEPSSHTHSHPLFWRFFEDYKREKELPLLERYPPRPKDQASLIETIKTTASPDEWKTPVWSSDVKATHAYDSAPPRLGRNDESDDEVLKKYYHTPRSYACKPFDLDQEILGSIAVVNALSPEGKKATLIQWSGDTSPFAGAIAKAREAGLLNINGGDSRFDNEYPSYSSVAPIGLAIDGVRQIYSSNSNENTYTNLWRDRFFGFRYLQTTVQNTENPIRVSPFNLYFHVYSAQKQASLNAVKENLEFARTQHLIPITASAFARIADGFYAASITQLSPLSWKITNRGALETVRFDLAEAYDVDFTASKGVLGARFHQASLYVALDASADNPVIVLKNNKKRKSPPPLPTKPYLIESTWQINNLQDSKLSLTFSAHGYGNAQMTWIMPKPGKYKVLVKQRDAIAQEIEASADENHAMTFTVDKVNPATVYNFEILAR